MTNVTAIASDAGGVGLVSDAAFGGICVPPYGVDSHAINVIARGGAYDVKVFHVRSGAHHSTSPSRTSAGTRCPRTRPGAHYDDGGGNQDAEPLFAAPAALDFHELAGSPTIDAGGRASSLSATDLDGEPRVQGTAPDVGADETSNAPRGTPPARWRRSSPSGRDASEPRPPPPDDARARASPTRSTKRRP